MEKALHTAIGVRDVYGEELRKKRKIMRSIDEVFRSYAYDEIETPTFEYFDVFGREIGTTPSRDLYKFFDREGDTLVLRPDFTPSVARAVAMYLQDVPRPLRLYYSGNTFVNSKEFRGILKENTQMGVERMGENSPEADAEVIALVIDAILAAGITRFQVSIGEVNFFKSLCGEARLPEELRETIRTEIIRKNFYGVEDLLRSYPMESGLCEAFVRLPRLFGGREVLSEAAKYAVAPASEEAIERLLRIDELLRAIGRQKYVSYDFGALMSYHYYTGIIFSAYAHGAGEPVAKGGRYDGLLAHFGKPEDAVGAGIMIQQVMSAAQAAENEEERQIAPEVSPEVGA